MSDKAPDRITIEVRDPIGRSVARQEYVRADIADEAAAELAQIKARIRASDVYEPNIIRARQPSKRDAVAAYHRAQKRIDTMR